MAKFGEEKNHKRKNSSQVEIRLSMRAGRMEFFESNHFADSGKWKNDNDY